MKLPTGLRVGVATHTGLLRDGNEDDYLLVAPGLDRAGAGAAHLIAAIADGMGGIAGGAEASRASLRGFAAGFLRDDHAAVTGAPAVDPGAGPRSDATTDQATADSLDAAAAALCSAVAQGFAGACARVREQAQLVPALRDMGTTLTAVVFGGGRAVIGHVGDTRAYRLRGDRLERLTEDHAAKGQANRLLRCIGAGQIAETPDLAVCAVEVGDRFLLCSDGVWSTVPAPRIAEVLERGPPQAAAERLVALANAAGGPDNSTAIVVQVDPDGAGGGPVALPTAEASRLAELSRRPARLGPPRWPWLLLAVSLLLLAAVLLRAVFGFDVFVWLRQSW